MINNDRKDIFETATRCGFDELMFKIRNKSINPYVLDNIIDDDELNAAGLQVYRWLAYEQAFEDKMKQCSLHGSHYHSELIKNGFIKIDDLFPQEFLDIVHRDMGNIPTNILERAKCENIGLNLQISSAKIIQDIFKLCQANPSYMEEILYLRKISHMPFSEKSEDSRQYNFHVDKFYPNFKVWYFPFEVKEEDGPLGVFGGSHRCTVGKMRWVHERSVNKKDWSRLHYNVDDYEQPAASIGLLNPVTFAVPCNTLVVVDTRMFHRRTPAATGKLRFAFRAILKRNNIL
jgi:hypothetical protein